MQSYKMVAPVVLATAVVVAASMLLSSSATTTQDGKPATRTKTEISGDKTERGPTPESATATTRTITETSTVTVSGSGAKATNADESKNQPDPVKIAGGGCGEKSGESQGKKLSATPSHIAGGQCTLVAPERAGKTLYGTANPDGTVHATIKVKFDLTCTKKADQPADCQYCVEVIIRKGGATGRLVEKSQSTKIVGCPGKLTVNSNHVFDCEPGTDYYLQMNLYPTSSDVPLGLPNCRQSVNPFTIAAGP